MLVLSRFVDEVIVIGEGANRVEAIVLKVEGEKVRLGITSPKNIPIHRKEIHEKRLEEGTAILDNDQSCFICNH